MESLSNVSLSHRLRVLTASNRLLETQDRKTLSSIVSVKVRDQTEKILVASSMKTRKIVKCVISELPDN